MYLHTLNNNKILYFLLEILLTKQNEIVTRLKGYRNKAEKIPELPDQINCGGWYHLLFLDFGSVWAFSNDKLSYFCSFSIKLRTKNAGVNFTLVCSKIIYEDNQAQSSLIT